MSRTDEAKVEFDELVAEGKKILKSVLADEDKSWGNFQWVYQSWYTRALPAVELIAPDRYEEFRRYYEPDPKRKSLGYGTYVIQDFFKGVAPNNYNYPNFDTKEQVKTGVYNQLTLIKGITSRINSVLADLETEIYTEFKDSEIETARALVKVSARASGALAGVVLEGYLNKLCTSHNIKFRKKAPTISDYNEALKKAKILNTPTWRKITYLGDIRNLCTHKKDVEPTKVQVSEMIDGVDWVLKNIF